MKKEKSCGAVVWRLRDGHREYLIEHMKKGHLSIPKGHVEAGETEEQTALREIREETNLEVRLDTRFRHVVTYSPSADVIKDVVFFTAEALPGPMVNQEAEVSALSWMPYEEAVAAVTYPTDKETLEQAHAWLG